MRPLGKEGEREKKIVDGDLDFWIIIYGIKYMIRDVLVSCVWNTDANSAISLPCIHRQPKTGICNA